MGLFEYFVMAVDGVCECFFFVVEQFGFDECGCYCSVIEDDEWFFGAWVCLM